MLIVATEPQMRERDLLAHEVWGRGLTPEGFAERERALRDQAWAREVMTTWLLVDEAGAILSSCETFRMESSLEAAATPTAPGSTYGIASVFTEPRLRGRGHAARMMSLLPQALLARDSAAHACILFSDVGPSLYARVGYAARPAFDRVFKPEEGDPAEGVEVIGERDIADALARVPRPASGFVIWPTAGQIDWHIERERVYASLLGGERPTGSGARKGGSVALWAANFLANQLFILLLHSQDGRELQAIVRSARRTARRAGLSQLTCWECPTGLPWPEGPDGGERQARDGALPMLLPLDPRVSPDDWAVIPKALWV